MSIERELGALTAEIKNLNSGQQALFKKFDDVDTKMDTLVVNQAILKEAYDKHKKLTGGAILAGITAVFGVIANYILGRQ